VEETLGDGPGEKFGEYTSYDPSYRGNTGRRFLEAAQQVLRSAQQQVQRSGNRRLARAMSRYESARELSRVLDAHDAMADAWGADRPSPVDIEAPPTATPARCETRSASSCRSTATDLPMDETRRAIDWMKANMPTPDPQLNEAWERVVDESPADRPEDCPLIRGLVQAKMDVINDLRKTA
jgi:hypothetical protein